MRGRSLTTDGRRQMAEAGRPPFSVLRPPSSVLRFARRLVPAAFFTLAAFPSLAGEIFAGRLYTVPEKIYVNQAFEIHFELEVSSGCEVEDLRISDFPNNPELLTVGRLENASRNRITRDKQAIDVLHFIASARCHKPVDHTFAPGLHCMFVERRTSGFFSHWQSSPKQHKLDPFALRVSALPEEGRPSHFSGAIGVFRLNGRLSQTLAHPGDIITLSLELSGQGWLADAVMPTPPDSPLFKVYPAKERVREPLRIQTEQVFIPSSTNAAEIAAARFCFFNPATGRYEESVAGPFRLTFIDTPNAPKTDEVRVISTAASGSAPAASQTVTLERVNLSLRHAVPLLVGCAGALAAFFVFFQLFRRHTGLAFLLSAALLAASGGAAYALSGKTATVARTLDRRTDVLFAPSHAAAILFTLNPGTPVIPLETAGTWIRMDAAGRRGWIPASSLRDKAAPQ